MKDAGAVRYHLSNLSTIGCPLSTIQLTRYLCCEVSDMSDMGDMGEMSELC
jgi:hypothetical protein